jgi:hypothetical protein
LKKLALLAILLSTAAYAQEDAEAKPKQAQAAPVPTPAPSPAPIAPAVPPALTLDQSDLAVLNQCIGELPYKVANPFVQKLNAKLNLPK